MVAMTPEGDTHERRYIRNVPEELWQRLRVFAATNGVTMSQVIIEAIEDRMDQVSILGNREERE